jgi:hypothetical protein
MATFDPILWHTRAKTRCERAVKRGAKPKLAKLDRKRSDNAIVNITTLVSWCETKGIVVTFCRRKNGIFYPATKEIKISCRMSPENQLYIMLHECGHFLVGDKEKGQRFGMGYSQVFTPNAVRTVHHKIDILDEELEAWHRGLKLASRIGLVIDKERFDKMKTMMINSYIHWAAR